ncbi:MAG: hypothetical protein H6737_04840 [Alphaproteobacteria bacterium]|nr:hypothetical protein [Alphaproteobacteria bacterium]
MILVLSAFAGLPCGFTPPPFTRPVVPKSHGTELEVRDAFGFFEPWESDHFAIKWGPDLSPSDEDLAHLASDLETIWARQVDDMGWLPPAGSEAYKLNVYLASTGGGTPEIDFDGGYVWVDDEGFPYIALYPASLDLYDNPAYGSLAELAAHEFNHTLQIRNSAFSNNRYGPFLWEATASWVVPQTFSTEPHPGWGGFLLHPHVALDMWALWGDDPSREARQYDTALFLHHLTEQQGLGADWLRDAWLEAAPEDEPLAYFDASLDGGLRDLYLDFAVRYALGDHDLAGLYEEGADELARWGVPDDRITEKVPWDGTAGMVKPPRGLRPEAFAWNHVTWLAVGPGTVRVDFAADEAGGFGTPAALTPFVAHQTTDGFVFHAPGETIAVLAGETVHLVVVSVPENAAIDERFGYQYAFAADVEPPPLASPGPHTYTEGCGCASPGGSVGWVWLAVVLPWRRMREGRDTHGRP